MTIKILACGVAAMALTAAMGSAFLDTSSAVRALAQRESVRAVASVNHSEVHLLRAILPRFTG
jgi:hypothetical protein